MDAVFISLILVCLFHGLILHEIRPQSKGQVLLAKAATRLTAWVETQRLAAG
jgi:hypothetical protein